jgi:hypothetical protein
MASSGTLPMKRLLILPAFALLLLLVSCAPLRRVGAYFRSTDEFHPVGGNVCVEELVDADFALQIQSKVPIFVDSVQTKLGLKFTEPVCLYLCHSIDSFCAHTGSKKPGPRASMLKKLFISPRLKGTPDWESIIYHELVHLVLRQHMSLYNYQAIPVWFHEGLATLTSNGGGSGDVTDSVAVQTIIDGKHFDPVEKENFLQLRSFERNDVSIWTQYRQSMLFVRFIKGKDSARFQNLINELVSGVSFAKAIRHVYNTDTPTLWTEFTSQLSKP